MTNHSAVPPQDHGLANVDGGLGVAPERGGVEVHNRVATLCAASILSAIDGPTEALLALQSIAAAVIHIRFPDPTTREAAASVLGEIVVDRLREHAATETQSKGEPA